MKSSSRLRSRGWGPFQQQWYSICSTHQRFKLGCPRCETGQWVNVWRQRGSSLFFKVSPRLWRVWANRPFCNGDRTWLESVFPGLKKP